MSEIALVGIDMDGMLYVLVEQERDGNDTPGTGIITNTRIYTDHYRARAVAMDEYEGLEWLEIGEAGDRVWMASVRNFHLSIFELCTIGSQDNE